MFHFVFFSVASICNQVDLMMTLLIFCCGNQAKYNEWHMVAILDAHISWV
jgi:hypothetical protein